MSSSADLASVLHQYWGFASFRPLQREAMDAILQDRDSVVVLPTGGGKSLCFQAPALVRPGLAIVVSPLISLMKDQVDTLTANGVPAACYNSSLSADEKAGVSAGLREGRYRLLYVSPERLAGEGSDTFLERLDRCDVGFVAIDEAHVSLRELLATYRLRIDERGLVPALEGMVQRFSDETGIAVFFHNECRELSLTPQQEIQVYHIIQEALSNIRKHSHANTARIRIDSEAPDRYTVLIEDDGEGMTPPDESLPGEHIGLSVMQDRARRLPGELTIESEPGEGTRVLLSFSSTEQAPPARAVGN